MRPKSLSGLIIATLGLTATAGMAQADDRPFKVSGSFHAKTELLTFYPADGTIDALSVGANQQTNNLYTSMEGFLKGEKSLNDQTSVAFRIPVSGLPYFETRNDLLQAWATWSTADKKWVIDLGRFGTRFSLESDELAQLAFANHGLLWGEILTGSSGATIYPSLVPPRGHTGLRLSTQWSQGFRTEFTYAAPEAFNPGSSDIEAGGRMEFRFNEKSFLTLGVLHSVSLARESRQLLHAGAVFQVGETELTPELLWCTEKLAGLARVENYGMALRSRTPLSESLGLGLRAEYDTNSKILASGALNQEVSDVFDIRYQLSAMNLDPDNLDPASIELGISGSFRF
jgi:hypothetical protein